MRTIPIKFCPDKETTWLEKILPKLAIVCNTLEGYVSIQQGPDWSEASRGLGANFKEGPTRPHPSPDPPIQVENYRTSDESTSRLPTWTLSLRLSGM